MNDYAKMIKDYEQQIAVLYEIRWELRSTAKRLRRLAEEETQ